MSKAVFITKVNPTYDDLPEGRYHFPRQYLNQVKRAVGDLIVYYEPRRQDSDDRGREGRQAYFATARVDSVEEDPQLHDHFYARISEYLEFDQPVPFRVEQFYFESSLQKKDGSTNRESFGRSVRIVPDDEFKNILRAGFAPVIGDQQRTNMPVPGPGFQEEQIVFQRSFVEQVVRRPFRDSAFARNVAAAYDQTCAMTGLKLSMVGAGPKSKRHISNLWAMTIMVRIQFGTALVFPVQRTGCLTADWFRFQTNSKFSFQENYRRMQKLY